MSGGVCCQCDERKKPMTARAWVVLHYKCNYSAFNGYRYTPSKYSEVRCTVCGVRWRTTAAYVETLQKGANAI